MTQVFAVDSKNDLYINNDGLMAINQGLNAVIQACEHVAKSQLLEMVLDQDRGVPNFETVWNGSPNIAQFESYLRRNLLTVKDVIEISSLETRVQNNVLLYTAEIRTIYGTGVLNGL
jgi:hypothetical protein